MTKHAIVITNGCPENRLDCAETEQFLIQSGWDITSDVYKANLIILNLCGLLEKTEKESLNLVKWANEKRNKETKLVVTGCLPKINHNCINHITDSTVVKGHNVTKLSNLLGVDSDSNDFSANYLISNELLPKIKNGTSLAKIKNRFSINNILHRFKRVEYMKYWRKINIVQPNTFYIKVSSGCVHACSYCAVKKSRGSVKSKTVEAVKAEFIKGLKAGYTEFALIGTDLGSYGLDIQTDLLVLLRKLVSIDGKFNIKLRNVHPQLLINQLPEFLSIARTNKISHITTAIQHGNDRVLRKMKRSYKIKDCKFAINALKNACPNLEIRAQIIVGFPGETDSEFNDTLRLIGDIKVDFVEAYPYSPRIGTLAAKMPNQISEKIINKRRYIIIKKLLRYLKGANVSPEKNEFFNPSPVTVRH